MNRMATTPGESLTASVRRQRMLELIGREGFARVTDLGEAFRVSEVTVRSDLDLLDEQRAIRRVHGGAVLRGAGEPREASFEESVGASAAEKTEHRPGGGRDRTAGQQPDPRRRQHDRRDRLSARRAR